MKTTCSLAAAAATAMFMAMPAGSAVVQGTFEGIVTVASDPGQAAFGRDPAEWLGKTVTGTFRYDIEAVPAIDDNPDPRRWNYVLPGGGEWIVMRATIDGVEFSAVRPGEFVSGNVQIWDDSFGAGDWFSVQAAGGDIGRKVVVFDAYGPPSLFSYSGGDGSLRFKFDPAAGAFGVGLIEDLYDPNGVVERHGVIRFNLTSLAFGRTPAQIFDQLEDKTVGVGPRSINNGVKTARAYYEANDIEAAGLQIEETENQVQVFIRAPDANKNRIEPELGEEILGDFDELKGAIGYGSD